MYTLFGLSSCLPPWRGKDCGRARALLPWEKKRGTRGVGSQGGGQAARALRCFFESAELGLRPIRASGTITKSLKKICKKL